MFVSVIISTYNAPEWLAKTVWGYQVQTHRDFELVIADDGSRETTRDLVRELRNETGLHIKHVWHPDDGFRKSAILNKATLVTDAEYLVFTDGDCIPRMDFLAAHIELAERGRFLSGGYLKLPMELSQAIGREDILEGRATDLHWLRDRGLQSGKKAFRLSVRGRIAALMDAITTTRPTWNGHVSSGWKEDILSVNGHDERMGYGGQDRELGERLVNSGVQGKQIRHRAIVVHLDHARGYKDPDRLAFNRDLRARTRRESVTWTEHGILKGPRPGGTEHLAASLEQVRSDIAVWED